MSSMNVRRATWGALILWIGVMMAVDEAAGVASLGAGVILLASAGMRRSLGRRAGPVLWIMGALLIVLGVNDLNGDDRGIPLFAVALIAFGALTLVRALAAPKRTSVEFRRGEGPTITIHKDPPEGR